MLFDIGLVIACHFITANLSLLGKGEPGFFTRASRFGAKITILVGLLAITDLIYRKVSGIF